MKEKSSPARELPSLLSRATERYKMLVKDLGNTPQRDVAQARHHLKTLLGSINLVPPPEGHLVAELRHNKEGIADITYGNDWKILLVVCESDGQKARNDYQEIPKHLRYFGAI